ncbi:MAG: hypothetical protein VX546_07685 [Myxococcota bacterium]|nr:hypothetical protein [Myxococcota bacterium]
MSRRAAFAWIAAACGIGFALRGLGLGTDFWLDEVWTWRIAAGVRSVPDVFTAIHHSNNHHLNTLFFYWIGDTPHAWIYRLPALTLGTASIGLGAAVAWRRGRLEAVLAAWLLAGSFALVHFSSEARGSGPAVAFALAGLWWLERDLERPRASSAVAFGLCVVAGFLYQLVFCFFWAGALVQSGVVLWPQHRAAGPWLRAMARLHGAPLLAFAALWLVDLRQLRVGGGPAPVFDWLAARTVGFSLGLPAEPAFGIAWTVLALGVVVAGLRLLAKRADPAWTGFAVTIVIAPLLVLGAIRPDVLAVRYFLIGIAFSLLLTALLLAAALRAGGARRVAAALLLAGFAVGNGIHIARFAELGRGGYRAALATLAAQTDGPVLEVGSDHDFRVGTVLGFHSRSLPPEKRLVYLPRRQWPQAGPEWMIFHRQERAEAPPTFLVNESTRYTLAAEFDHAAISGYYWMLYRNTDRSAETP